MQIDITAYRLATTGYKTLGSGRIDMLDGTTMWNVRLAWVDHQRVVQADSSKGLLTFDFDDTITFVWKGWE